MSKKLSVIVPVYNVEKYLDKCLGSIVHQTFDDMEIIVVNDGSPDGSQAIVDRYAREYPDMIRSFVKENGGLSDARNYGIERASGEYIAFVDSDDYLAPDMYEQLLTCAEKHDSDVVCCMFMSEWEDGMYECIGPKHLKAAGHSVAQAPEVLLLAKSYAWNKIFRRSLFTESGMRFPVGQYYEDSAMVYNLLSYANRIDYVSVPLYYYLRDRSGAITSQNDRKMFDVFKSCDSIREFYGAKKDYSETYRDVVTALIYSHLTARFSSLIGTKEKRLAKKYINRVFSYLNANCPGWKNIVHRLIGTSGSKGQRIFQKMKVNRGMMKLMVSLPSGSGESLRSGGIKKIPLLSWLLEKRKKKANQQKAAAVRATGFELINKMEEVASAAGVQIFSDFGTLLGFVRDNGFMKHDIDIDMGVILGDVPYEEFHKALEEHGFRLWRRYCIGSRAVEESYHYVINGKKVKCDFNYYEVTPEYSKTWLFYRKPGVAYGANTRNIVEMRYSPIGRIVPLNVDGHNVPVPENPEQLLCEKYGESWTTPDTGWIYWQSPAAVPLEEIGYFVTEA